MRLTADVLSRAEQFLNPLKERELHLRGLKIPAIENLAVVQDQYDSIDFSDNEIKRLDNFPKMNRLTTIIINNNYVAKIGNVGENVPNMKCLVLTNNRIIHLSEIDNISSFKKLEHLSLLENPVTIKQNYRDYIIYKIPSLKSLDFKKISMKEREQSKKFMKSNLGVLLLASISNEQTDSNETNGNGKKIVPAIVLTDEQKALVRAAIENAKTREDVEIIEKHLKIGSLAFLTPKEPSVEEPSPTPKEDSVEVPVPGETVGVDEEKKEESL